MSSQRLHGFARIPTWDRVSASENYDERTVPKEHVLRQSLLTQHPAEPHEDTNASLFHIQRDSV